MYVHVGYAEPITYMYMHMNAAIIF